MTAYSVPLTCVLIICIAACPSLSCCAAAVPPKLPGPSANTTLRTGKRLEAHNEIVGPDARNMSPLDGFLGVRSLACPASASLKLVDLKMSDQLAAVGIAMHGNVALGHVTDHEPALLNRSMSSHREFWLATDPELRGAAA